MPCLAASRTLPPAATLKAMSSTMGPWLALGAAKAMGLLPMVLLRPPQGAMPGKPLVQLRPIMSLGRPIMA
ncbi:hypothetical protein D3C85_1360770 [compost metagenome]